MSQPDTNGRTRRATAVPPPFSCELEPDRERVVVRPRGEIDLHTARVVEQRLQDAVVAGFRHVVLDLRGVTFLGSSGLRVAVAFAQSASRAGIRFSLERGPAVAMRPIALSGLQDVLPCAR